MPGRDGLSNWLAELEIVFRWFQRHAIRSSCEEGRSQFVLGLSETLTDRHARRGQEIPNKVQ